MASNYGRLGFPGSGFVMVGKDDVVFDDPDKLLLWDAAKVLNDSFGTHDQRLPRLLDIIARLQHTLEASRVAYNQAIVDRDAKRQQLVSAEARLADVQRVVQRYTVVQDPVVASDGYTYERSIIKQYLDECQAADAVAHSQQTKEVLKDVLIPNQSLKKLVELLRTVKPLDIPAAVPRSQIPPFRGGNPVNWVDDDEAAEEGASNKDKKPIHAAELEAAFSKPAQTRSETAEAKKPAEPPAKQGESKREDGHQRPATTTGRDRSSASGKQDYKLHPCLRVYGFCNFKDDCTFARYPYDACLNNIKGKCRFGSNCKELHVNPNDPKYQNPRNAAATQGSRSGQ